MFFKKTITSLFALLTVVSIVVLSSGCKGEIKPFFPTDEQTGHVNIGERQRTAYFENMFDGVFYDREKEFFSYCEKELKQTRGESYYLLQSGFQPHHVGPTMHSRVFGVYRNDEKALPPVIMERIDLYDPDYIDYEEIYPDASEFVGSLYQTVKLNYYTYPVKEEINANEYRLEFGINTDGEWFLQSFINIYAGEACIGTCYYYEYLPVSEEWFAEYFKKNLIRI